MTRIEHPPAPAVESPEEPPFAYRFLPDPRQRELLAEAMEAATDHVAEAVQDRPPGTVIFLDKAARPLSTAFRAFWQKKFPDDRRPEIEFFNIGREYSGEEKRSFQLDAAMEAEIISLRQTHRLAKAPAGSRVVIIDDLSSSGGTEQAAITILTEAFPQLSFEFHPLRRLSKGRALKDQSPAQLFDYNDTYGYRVTLPPWTHLLNVPSPLFGITGVVDPERPASLAASPYHVHRSRILQEKMSLEARMEPYVEELMPALREIATISERMDKKAPTNIAPYVEEHTVRYSGLPNADYSLLDTAIQAVHDFTIERFKSIGAAIDATEPLEETHAFTIIELAHATHQAIGLDINERFRKALEASFRRDGQEELLSQPWFHWIWSKYADYVHRLLPATVRTQHLFLVEPHNELHNEYVALRSQARLSESVWQLRKEMAMLVEEYWQNHDHSQGRT